MTLGETDTKCTYERRDFPAITFLGGIVPKTENDPLKSVPQHGLVSLRFLSGEAKPSVTLFACLVFRPMISLV